MTNPEPNSRQWSLRGPHAAPDAFVNEPAPFPKTTDDAACESGFSDWRERLTRNLSRRSDGRWEPLTRTHGAGQSEDGSGGDVE